MKSTIALFILVVFSGNLRGQSSTFVSFVDSFALKNNFNGTILVQQKSAVTYEKSFGLANFVFKVSNNTETKYKIASITKLFTSVLIMKLVERGELDLKRTIKTYLPEYKGEGGSKVTIHQLLNHTSGLANIDTVKSFESALKNGIPLYQKPRTTDELLDSFCSGKLVNEPGKVFDYNNADYIVLGKIIEKICHKTFEQLAGEYILQPLKMRNTGLLYQKDIISDLADTYFYRDHLKKLVPDLPVYMENWYAAGSMYSTTHDLLLFMNALFGHQLLTQSSLDRMFTPGLDEYGYGVWVHENYRIKDKIFTIVKRPGRIMGAQAMLFHILGDGTTIIILSNTGTTSLDDFAAQLANRLIR